MFMERALMADVIRGRFGEWRQNRAAWAKYEAQEPGDIGQPDMERPPGEEDSGTDPDDVRDVPEGLGAPPFTGEDAEDVGRNPQKHHGINPHADLFI
jgi:hypothetical protein